MPSKRKVQSEAGAWAQEVGRGRPAGEGGAAVTVDATVEEDMRGEGDAVQQTLYEMKARILQAVAHPVRVAIVDCLGEGEVCVCEIARRIGAQRSNVSRHLSLMLQAGVVASRKEGLKVFYRLATPCLANFFVCVDQLLRDRARQASAAVRALDKG